MNIETAGSLHQQLLEALPGYGDATSALSDVVRTHAPKRDAGMANCAVCVNWHEESVAWPCVTIAVINAYAHVDGIPAGAEAWWSA